MDTKLVWTGARASDIRNTDNMFYGSITIFGTNESGRKAAYCSRNNVRLNHNIDSQNASDFILKKQLELIEEDPAIRFMPYNPNCIYGTDERVFSHTICMNAQPLMEMLNNKIAFRKWATSLDVSLLEYHIVVGKMLPSFIEQKFSCKKVVVQTPNSSGGEGTFIVDGRIPESTLPPLLPDDKCVVTEYVEENIPINIHCVLYRDGYVIFPGSIQLVIPVDGKLLYRGADFVEYRSLPAEYDIAFKRQIAPICQALIQQGYRGVIGFDAIISNGCVFIQEVNNRFQGSTYPLNKALSEQGYPSVQKFHYDSFMGEAVPENRAALEAIDIPYSYFVFAADAGLHHAKYLYGKIQRQKIPEVACYEDDGLSFDSRIDKCAPLFSAMFRTNISSLVPFRDTVRIHPGLIAPTEEKNRQICDSADLTPLKTALINEGITIRSNAIQHLTENYGLNVEHVFNIDIELTNGHYANCPLSIKLCGLTPFELDYAPEKGLTLYYYGEELMRVRYVPRLCPPVQRTKNRVPCGEIAFFATDRLRLQNSASCCFGSYADKACRFCETFGTQVSFSQTDILETIDVCFREPSFEFRHILIGGRSATVGTERNTILAMCERIRHYSDMPIYLMCLPPKHLMDIDEYIDAGVTEFGFNMELFDRRLAKLYMPAKGAIPTDQYLEALEYAASRCGKNGEVRSAFIVGLEPLDSLLSGVEAVCATGAVPIFSAFRPIPGTPMQDIIPVSSAWLTDATYRAEKICKQYGRSLGPQCLACQNNTLNVLSR